MKLWISLSNIEKYYDDKPIFQWASFSLMAGQKAALIGKNWSWKSTLFRLLLNKERYSSWVLSIKWFVTHIEQEFNENLYSYSVERFFLQYIQEYELYKAYDALDQLWIPEINMNQTIWSLSWWQKKKLLLSKLILQQYDIVLLDEPTNHLDSKTRQWLIDFINSYDWIVLCISHDRDFLNQWTNKILAIEDHKIAIYDGDYDDYILARDTKFEKAELDYTNYQKKKKKMEEWLRDLRQRATVYDSPKWWKLLRSKEKFYQREIVNKEVKKPVTDKQLNLSMAWSTHSGKRIMEFENYNLSVWDNLLLSKIKTRINGVDRIALSGENGVWKTTLLKTMLHHLLTQTWHSNLKFGVNLSIGYFDQQNLFADGDQSAIARLEKTIGKNKPTENLISALAAIGIVDGQIKKKTSQLSYGERVKLKFLELTSQRADFLVLDEPTNHLDIPTIESLEDMLCNYEWALIVVSHDKYFLDQIMINKFWEIKDKKLVEE